MPRSTEDQHSQDLHPECLRGREFHQGILHFRPGRKVSRYFTVFSIKQPDRFLLQKWNDFFSPETCLYFKMVLARDTRSMGNGNEQEHEWQNLESRFSSWPTLFQWLISKRLFIWNWITWRPGWKIQLGITTWNLKTTTHKQVKMWLYFAKWGGF